MQNFSVLINLTFFDLHCGTSSCIPLPAGRIPLSWQGRNAGFHLLLTIKSGGAEEELAAAAREADVRIAPMGYTWWNRPAWTEPSFILGFGGIPEERIDDGIKALKEAWLD
ncbi:hypothetical protein [Paenibacillus sophorae]|nr:hypothetical protein [Paenibacillus sophorae]QWU16507.1 hypothetical protein KP014_04525 [Paenibacillus sophorae]